MLFLLIPPVALSYYPHPSLEGPAQPVLTTPLTHLPPSSLPPRTPAFLQVWSWPAQLLPGPPLPACSSPRPVLGWTLSSLNLTSNITLTRAFPVYPSRLSLVLFMFFIQFSVYIIYTFAYYLASSLGYKLHWRVTSNSAWHIQYMLTERCYK